MSEKVKIEDIKIIGRRRAIDDAKVVEIAQSIEKIGLINSITIKPNRELIAGLHRLKACQLLGRAEIDANIIDLDELDTKLVQIDENLTRAELHYIEKGELFKTRKEIYERKYPETKKGMAQARGMNKALGYNVSAESAPTFNEDTAKKLNISKRAVQELIYISENLDAEVKQMVMAANLKKCDALDLIRLSKGDSEIQKAAIGKVAARICKTIAQAIKAGKKPEPVPDKLPASPTLKQKILKPILFERLANQELEDAIEILKDYISLMQKELEKRKLVEEPHTKASAIHESKKA